MLLKQVSHWNWASKDIYYVAVISNYVQIISNSVELTLLCFTQQLTSIRSAQLVIISSNTCTKDSQSMWQSDFMWFSAWESCPFWQYSSWESCPFWQYSSVPIFKDGFCVDQLNFSQFNHFKNCVMLLATAFATMKKRKCWQAHTCALSLFQHN